VRFTVDQSLVFNARKDDAALEALLTALWPEAYRVSFGVLHDHGLAEDAAQETCAIIAHGLPALRSDEAFYRWMYRIIVRHAIASGRRRKKMASLDASAGPSTLSSAEEHLDLLHAIEALPVVQRAAIILRYYAGFNSGEIAGILRMPATTVRFHLMLARRGLRATLAVIEVEPQAHGEACTYVR
jgi:RNA polymerase sigma-70 factor (ECF subfamily)